MSAIVKQIRKNKRLISFLEKSFLGNRRAEIFFELIKPCITKKDKILDIGAGACVVSKHFIQKGYSITPVDIVDVSLYEELKPVLYGGKKIPFKDKSFDVAFVLTVLHHTTSQKQILEEARRVAKKVVIIEDIYRNKFEKFITSFFDSLVNFEFFGHPHTNRSHKGWMAFFKKMKFRVTYNKIRRFNWMFVMGVYCLEQ